MRPEYDFSHGKRGVTARRCAQGANVVVISPEVLDVVPDGAAVNEALRALAPVLRRCRATECRAPCLTPFHPGPLWRGWTRHPSAEARRRAAFVLTLALGFPVPAKRFYRNSPIAPSSRRRRPPAAAGLSHVPPPACRQGWCSTRTAREAAPALGCARSSARPPPSSPGPQTVTATAQDADANRVAGEPGPPDVPGLGAGAAHPCWPVRRRRVGRHCTVRVAPA